MNRACFAVDTDRNGYETALPVFVSRYKMNRASLEGDNDWIENKTALPVIVLRCVVT